MKMTLENQRALEMARRLYAEVVKGRTRVRIVESSEVADDYPARFILSPYRSGTTLLRYCLDSHPNIAVPPESDFIYPLSSVLDDRESLIGIRDLGYTEEEFARRLGAFGRRLHDIYARGKGAEVWIDKSPRYASIPDKLLKLYPEALFVILARHPLDQIHSFTRGGTFAHDVLEMKSAENPHEVLTTAAKYWSDVMLRLYNFSLENSKHTTIITYESLCETPEATLKEVLRHYGLDWRTDVLEYHKFDHDKGREAGRVAGTVGFSASAGGWRSWDALTIEKVRHQVSDTGKLYGYDLNQAI